MLVGLRLKRDDKTGDKMGSLLPVSVLDRLAIFLISIFYAAAFIFPFYLLAADNDNTQQLKSMQQDIVKREKSVKQQQQQRVLLQNQLKEQEKSIAQSSRTLRNTQMTLEGFKRDVAHIDASMKQLHSQEQQQQTWLKQQLEMAFRLGKHSGLQFLLNNEENQRNERILAYLGYLNQSREKSITELQQTHAKLIEQKHKQEVLQHKQQEILTTQQQIQQTLKQTQRLRQKTLASLETSLTQQQQQLAEIKQNEAKLREKIANAERAARARLERETREAAALQAQMKTKQQQAQKKGTAYQPTESERALMARTGGLGRPMKKALWPVRGQITHQFGELLQGELRWKGIVITASEGTEVKAIADGRVLLADWLQGYGLVVVVEHGKGDMSLYGYNQSALVNVGAQVHAGQPIALVGNSGGQGSAALYFEIRRQGQALDPMLWLSG